MGKYSSSLAGKPRLAADPSQREEVERLKVSFLDDPAGPPSLGVVTQMYADARDDADGLQRELNQANAAVEALRQILVEKAEKEGVQSLRLADGRGVVIVIEPYPNVVDAEAFRRWCIEQGLENRMTLHPSTAKALVKERLLAGEAEPPGVEIYSKETIRLDRRRS